jgi:hypothetical protein
VAWSGADLPGIVSLRNSYKVREARQVLWLGEGCEKRFSVFFNPVSFLSRLHLPRISPLSPSFHTPNSGFQACWVS